MIGLKCLIEGLQVRASLDFSRQNGIKCKLSNVITSSQRHSCTQCFTHSSGLILRIFKFKTLFKQHVNPKIPVSFI